MAMERSTGLPARALQGGFSSVSGWRLYSRGVPCSVVLLKKISLPPIVKNGL